MFCLNCGSKLPDNATFCNTCGNRMSTETAGSGQGTGTNPTFMPTGPTPGTPPPPSYSAPTNPNPYTQYPPIPQMAQGNPSTGGNAPIPPTFYSPPPPPPVSTAQSNTPWLAPMAPPSPSSSPYASPNTNLSLPHNLGFIIAIASSLLALIAFFFVPYFSVSFFSATAEQLASAGTQYGASFSSLQFLWLEPVIALAILGLSGWQLYQSSRALNSTARGAAIALISIAGLALLILFGRYIYDLQPITGSNFLGGSFSTPGIGSYYSSGFWVYIVSMIGVVTGGIVQLLSKH